MKTTTIVLLILATLSTPVFCQQKKIEYKIKNKCEPLYIIMKI